MPLEVAEPMPSHRPKTPLATEYCKLFYNLQEYSLTALMKMAEELRDPTIPQHLLECEQCRPHLLKRSNFSSFAEMDSFLKAEYERIKKLRTE